MKIRSAVLEILQEGRRTGRGVESKTLNFVNFDYESSANSYKTNLYCCLYLMANRNIASKVHRPTPTVLTNSTLLCLHKLYLQPHYTYSKVTQVATSYAHSLSRSQSSECETTVGYVGLYICISFVKFIYNARRRTR